MVKGAWLHREAVFVARGGAELGTCRVALRPVERVPMSIWAKMKGLVGRDEREG